MHIVIGTKDIEKDESVGSIWVPELMLAGKEGERSTKEVKIQKLAEHGDSHLQSRLLKRLRWENHLDQGSRGCSEPRSCHYTPAWVTRGSQFLNNTGTQHDRERVQQIDRNRLQKEHVLTQCKDTKNLEKRLDEMLTRIASLEKNINDLMELKNTA
ncbi:hypothetical protein AAY473_024981 [Plecturocebus cupreus]